MTCISALVMIVYQVFNCIISQPKHTVWVLKKKRHNETALLKPNYRLNLVSKKIFTILSTENCAFLDNDVYGMHI